MAAFYWLDIAAAFILGAYIVWWLATSIPNMQPPPNDDQKQLSASVTMEACTSSLTVAGIIFTVLISIQLFAIDPDKADAVRLIAPETLESLRTTTLWIAVSMVAGLWNICRFPSIVTNFDLLAQDKKTGILGVVQFLALLVAIIRSLFFLFDVGTL